MSRLKPNANPEIAAELREWRGDAIRLTDEQIQDVVDDHHREYIDVKVEATFQRREYAGTQSYDSKTFRVVGVLVPDADDYICTSQITREKSFYQQSSDNLSMSVGGRTAVS